MSLGIWATIIYGIHLPLSLPSLTMSVTSEFYKIPNHSYILKCDFNQVFAPCAATLRCPRLYFYSYPLTSYQSCGCRFSQNNANGFLMLTSLALLSPVFFPYMFATTKNFHTIKTGLLHNSFTKYSK